MRKICSALKKTWKFAVLAFLIVLTFSYAMFQGGFVSWFLFYSFLPFALYCLAIGFYSLEDIYVERVLTKTDYNAGESLTVNISLRRNSSFPLFFLIVEDQVDDTLKISNQQKRIKKLLFPGIRKEFSLEYKLEELPRGEHFFRAIELKTGDPLGLVEKETEIEIQHKIVVYPSYTELIYRPFANQFDQGMTVSRERVQRDTSMAIGIREYQPGDRFSWINWKASAKRNDIMTKEFEQRQSHDVYVVMDCLPDRHFETIVSFTASLVRSILKKGAQTGLLTNSKERAAFPFRGGEGHLHQLFYHLAKIQAKCSVPLDRTLEAEKFFSQRSSTLMIVTGQLTKALIEKASFFGQRKGTVTIFLLKDEKESPTQNDLSLKAAAHARGVRVILIHEGQFKAAFSEVSTG
jgi:uncharacterized protein (DUF58 family)